MASSSSANKVAKLAQKGKGKKVRFQGGTLFPVVIVVVVVLLGALVVYARQSRPGPGEGEPTANQHWHAALGFYVCDDSGLLFLPKLTGALEETDDLGQLSNQRYVSTGIHSHGDGVMHWHANSSGKATGTNARLKVFLENYAVDLSDSKLSFPAGQGGETYEEGKSTCKVGGVEKEASLKMWVWDSYADLTAEPQVYTTNMGDVRLKNDGMVFVVAFVPNDTEPKAPEWAFNLAELGAADNGGVVPATIPPNSDGTATTIAGSVATIADSDTTDGSGGTATTTGEPSATDPSTPDSTATTEESTATTAKSTATTSG